LFAWMVFDVCVRKHGAKASAGVWEGSHGLEWTLSSPPPYHSFAVPPVIDGRMLAHGDISH